MGAQFDHKSMIAGDRRGGNSGAISPSAGAREGAFWSNPPGEEYRAVCRVTIRGRYHAISTSNRALHPIPVLFAARPFLTPTGSQGQQIFLAVCIDLIAQCVGLQYRRQPVSKACARDDSRQAKVLNLFGNHWSDGAGHSHRLKTCKQYVQRHLNVLHRDITH